MAYAETISFKIMSLRCEQCGEPLRVPKEKTAYQVSSEHAKEKHGQVLSPKGCQFRCE